MGKGACQVAMYDVDGSMRLTSVRDAEEEWR
jgi:hypothetical protein